MLLVRNKDEIDQEIHNWCTETIGHRFLQWFSYSMDIDKRVYSFKDEETLLVFKLKWGQYVSG